MASTTLALGDDACMQTIGKLAERLLDAIVGGSSLRIDIGDAINADLSIIQLIEAARRHGDVIGCKLSLAGAMPAAVQETLDRAGFTFAATLADDTFWCTGDTHQ